MTTTKAKAILEQQIKTIKGMVRTEELAIMAIKQGLEPLQAELKTLEKQLNVLRLAEYGLKVGDKLLCTNRYKAYSYAVMKRFVPFDYGLVEGADSTDEKVWFDAYDNDREWPLWGHVVPVDIAKGMRQARIQEHGDE